MDVYENIHGEIKEGLCKWAVGEAASPVRMVFSVTERCNLKCLYCSGLIIHKGLYPKELIKKKNELSKDEWVRIAKEGAKLGIKQWSVLGGEPLLRYDTLFAMFHAIKNISPESIIELSTNGWFLNNKIAEKIIRLECDIIQLSIDGANAKTHDFLRGKKGSFKRITKGCKYLTSMKKEFGKKSIIQVNTVINSRNYDELPELVSLTGSLGADKFIANPMRVQPANTPWIKKANLELTNEQINQFHKVWKKVENIGKRHKIQVSTGLYGSIDESHVDDKLKLKKESSHEAITSFLDAFCFGPFYSLAIGATGRVGSCASSVPSSSPINISGKSLKELWYGNYFESARKKVLKGEPLFKECKTCGIVTQRFISRSQLSDLVGEKKPQIRTHQYGRELET